MGKDKNHFYFSLAIAAMAAIVSFAMLEVTNTMTEITFIENSFSNGVRRSNVRLTAEIGRSIEELDLGAVENEFKEIDYEINNL